MHTYIYTYTYTFTKSWSFTQVLQHTFTCKYICICLYIYIYAYRCFGLCMVHFHKSQRATQLTPICVYIHAHIHICLHANIGPQRKTNYFTKNKKQQFHQSQLATQLIPICIYIYTHISTCKHMPKKKAQLFHSKKKNNNFSKSACYPLIDVAFITSNFFVK